MVPPANSTLLFKSPVVGSLRGSGSAAERYTNQTRPALETVIPHKQSLVIFQNVYISDKATMAMENPRIIKKLDNKSQKIRKNC